MHTCTLAISYASVSSQSYFNSLGTNKLKDIRKELQEVKSIYVENFCACQHDIVFFIPYLYYCCSFAIYIIVVHSLFILLFITYYFFMFLRVCTHACGTHSFSNAHTCTPTRTRTHPNHSLTLLCLLVLTHSLAHTLTHSLTYSQAKLADRDDALHDMENASERIALSSTDFNHQVLMGCVCVCVRVCVCVYVCVCACVCV